MFLLNLQMFAYDKNSIVDYLKSTGQDSSYAARKEIAKSLGISNYSGTAAQNTQMLNTLKNSSATPSTSSGAPSITTPEGSYTKDNPYVVPSSNKTSKKKETSSFTQSSASKNASKTAQEKLEALDKFDVKNIISQDTWNAINTPFNSSTAYNDAMKYTKELLAQLSTGQTSYTNQIKDLLSQIQDRDPFVYDMGNDTLFQQSLASAMASGKMAMQDTMGQAASLTGGYGSTYATSAANQQYNAFIQDAYNNIPEYYELALQAYQMEGDEMYNQLAALSDASDTEYERMYNSWNSNFQSAQQMYQNEYTAWQDSVNTAIKNAGLQMDEFSTKYDQAYKTYQANQNYADNLYAQEFNKWSAEEDLGLSYAQMFQNQSQHDSDLKYKYDALEQDMKQYEKDLALQYEKLAQDQAQFNANLAAKKGPGYTGGSDVTLTNAEINAIKSAYEEAGGGEKGDMAIDAYLSAIGKEGVDPEYIYTIVSNMSLEDKLKDIPFYERAWTISDDTFNGNIFGLSPDDNNDVFTDGEVEMTFSELKNSLNDTKLDDVQKKAFLDMLRKQSKK